MAEASIDTQFQSWLTVTFATIVASFASRNLLTKSMRMLVVALYLVATFVLVSRWIYDAQDIRIYADMLATLGYIEGVPLATALSRMLLVALGTFSTLYFVFATAHEKSQ